METQRTTELEPNGQNNVRGRIATFVRGHSKGLSLLLLLVAWTGINYPGLGEMGLWDPWEMNRAQMARQMTEAPKVFVIESVPAGQSLGPLGKWIAARYQDHLQIASVDSPSGSKVRARKSTSVTPALNLENALNRLDESIFHLLVIDARAVVPDPRATNVVKTLSDWLERVEARNPGLKSLWVVRDVESTPEVLATDNYMETLRGAMAAARVNLAAHDLVGKGWGKSGAFRKSLHVQLRAASKSGYSPVHDGLVRSNESTSFLEESFWAATEKHRLNAEMKESISSSVVDQLAGDPLFAFTDPMVMWVNDEQHAALTKDFAGAPQEARSLVAHFESEVDRVFDQPWAQARLKVDGETRTLPPFDSWLVARSLSWFGFSERSCRIPAFVLGLLGLLFVYWIVSRVWGERIALLSCLVLATCPLYFAQGHTLSSDMSFMVSLIVVVGGLLMLIQDQHSILLGVSMLLIGALLGFLTKGVYGLLLPTTIALTYTLVARETRLVVWGCVGVLGLLVGGAWLMVYSSADGSFWSQFSFENALFEWNISPDARPIELNFDVLVRQIGFGAAPWSALLPLAFGYLVMRRTQDGERSSVVIVLWFAVPYVLQSVVMKDANHLVFPAIPALAVAVGLLLDRVLRGELLGVVGGTIAVVLLGILISELKKSPEPLTSFLTVDPPLHGAEGKGNYPESLKLSKWLLLSLSMMAAVIVLHATKMATKARTILAVFTRPKAFWIAFTAVVTLLVVRFVVGLETHIADLYAAGGPARHLEPIHRLYVRSVLYWRPETWAVLLIGLGGIAGLLRHHTSVFPATRRWLRHWIFTTPVILMGVTMVMLTGVTLAVSSHSDAVVALTQYGATALSVVGLLLGLAAVVASARQPDTASLLGVVVLATLVRLIAMPGALWLDDLGLLMAGANYALMEALVTTGLSLGFCGLGAVFLRRNLSTMGRVAIILAAGTVALPTIEPTGVLDLLAFVMGRMALLATLVTAFRGPNIVAALADTFPTLHFLTAPLAGWAVGVFGVSVGAVMLVSALTIEPGSVSSLAASLVWGALVFMVLFSLWTGWKNVETTPGRFALRWKRVGETWMRWVQRVRDWQERPSWILWTLGVALVCLGIAFERTLAWGQFSEGYVSWATIQSPVVWVGGLVGLVWLLGVLVARSASLSSRLLPDNSIFRGLHHLGDARLAWLVGGFLVAWIVGGCTVQLFRGSGFTLAHYQAMADPSSVEAVTILNRALLVSALVCGAALMAVLALWPFMKKHRTLAIGGVIVSGLTVACIFVIPLANKWVQLESAALPATVEPYLAYIFGKSRVSLLLYGLIGAVIVLGFAGQWARLVALLREKRSRNELVGLLWMITLVVSLLVSSIMPAVVACCLTAALFLVAKGAVIVSLLTRLRAVLPSLILCGVFAVIVAVGWLVRENSGSLAILLMAGGGAGIAGVCINVLARWIPPMRVFELVERPRVFVTLVAIFAGGFAFLYNQQLVSALSYHVSEKHILETVRVAEQDRDWTKRIYQIGIGKRSLVNFYTRDIPSVRNQDLSLALRALGGDSDQVLPVTYAGQSVTEHRLIRAFSADNDSDQDGHRDAPADAGIMTSVNKTEGSMVDSEKNWQPDMWKDSLLIDSDDWAFKVLSNTANSVVYERKGTRVKPTSNTKSGSRKSPRFDSNVEGRNRYILDAASSVVKSASAMTPERVYFLLPKIGQHAPAYSDTGSFSDLNHKFRKLSGGRHLVVLDDRSSRILLATQQLREGEQDRNWIRDAVMSTQEFETQVAAGAIRGADIRQPQAGIINWEDKLVLLGWRMDEYAVSKGGKLKIHLYFKSLKPLQKSLKIFMHIDRSGHRIHADHWILPVKKGKEGKHCIGCFQTNHWLAGDIVVDTFERDVPIGAPSGTTDIWLGFFNPQGDKRLTVTEWNEKIVHYPGRDNRVRIGSFEVR